MSMTAIKKVDAGSPAARAGVQAGETLTGINGHPIVDVLDYKFHSYDPRLVLTLRQADGGERTVKVQKQEGEDLGLNFETYLMDKARSCANNCIFCFVDQLPKGMRETLYFKDDDARLSFLMGNYITLTNLSDREVQRIIDLRVSPINVSVHATDPALRAKLLGFRNAGRGLDIMRKFARAGIRMNCQIVSCPGLNDGPQLQRSMADLEGLFPSVNSVSIVPVGLTKYREGLPELVPYCKETAGEVLDLVESFAELCRARHDTRIFWCSDEFYLRAERPIPDHDYFEEYTQLENGVGMLRLLEHEFGCGLNLADEVPGVTPYAIACGTDAAPWMQALVDRAEAKCHTKATVYPIVNEFLGETITVSGLITGGDLIAQLRDKPLPPRLFLPVNMLRHGEDVFLDDVTVAQVERALSVHVVPIPQDGYELCDAILEQNQLL